MHYQYLSELGQHYFGEEGTEGVRRGALDGLAGNVRSAIMTLNQAKAALTPPPATGSVNAKAAFFKDQADLTKQAALKKAVFDAEQKVEKCRKWLALQGATLDANGYIDWGVSVRTVVYDSTAVQQGMTMLRFNGGRLFTDDACAAPLDTKNTVTHFSGPGFAIYVMGATGNIHVSSHSVGNRHHSSLLGGQNTAGAGELRAEKGRLLFISNKSGHYAPSVAHMLQVLHQLQKKQVDLTSVKLTLKTAAGQVPYPNVQAFIAAVQAQGEPDFEYAKLLRYLVVIPFPQFSALITPQSWRWVSASEYAAGNRGVMTNAGVQVPHRDVRKFLKASGLTANADLQSGMGR